MVKRKQGGRDEGVDVVREIWEDPGIRERNKTEKRREDMRGGRECIEERAKGEFRGCLVFRSVRRRWVGVSGRGFEERGSTERGIEEQGKRKCNILQPGN